jgi:serine-type D-Ala-D-Ala carboxypeptidase/endopeptidase (penicillin-binding protein 4)
VLAIALLISVPALDVVLNNPRLEGAIVAAHVTRLDGKTIYERNPGLRVVPASNQKLLSTAFALHTVGPDYKPATKLWKTPTFTAVETTGDPMLTYSQLIGARDALKLNTQLPVHVKQPYAPMIPDSWEYDDLPHKYAAPITAFTVDRASFELWSKGGKPVFSPTSYNVQIVSEGGEGPPRVAYDPFRRVVFLSGQLPEKDTRLDTLSIMNPDREAAFLLGAGFSPVKDVPLRAPDYVIEGRPMAEMIAACLQPSDNNIAEHLMLMAAHAKSPLGERAYPPARVRMTEFLTQVAGLQPIDVRPMDGSGMSRHNIVTARGITQLLRWANVQPTAPLWRASLARPGVGTLANRLQGVEFYGKTGTLSMVSALSGYVKHKSGEDLVLSLVMNNYPGTAAEIRAIQDAFVKAAAEAEL